MEVGIYLFIVFKITEINYHVVAFFLWNMYYYMQNRLSSLQCIYNVDIYVL